MAVIETDDPDRPDHGGDDFDQESPAPAALEELVKRLASIPAGQREDMIVAALCGYPASAFEPGYFEGRFRALFVECLEQRVDSVAVKQLRRVFADRTAAIGNSVAALQRSMDQTRLAAVLMDFLDVIATELKAPSPRRTLSDELSADPKERPAPLLKTDSVTDLLRLITHLSREDVLAEVAAVVQLFGPEHKADLILAAAGIEPSVPGRYGNLVRPYRQELAALLECVPEIPLLETLRAAAKDDAVLGKIVHQFDGTTEVGTVRSALLRLLTAISNFGSE